MTRSYAKSVKEYVESKSSGPATITVNVTEYCQLSCPYCPHGYGYEPQGNMDWHTAQTLVQRIKESGFKGRVSISGNGEPALWPYLMQFLQELPDTIDKQVISNGVTEGFDFQELGKHCRLIISKHDKNAWLDVGDAIVRDCDPSSPGFDMKLTNRGGWLKAEQRNRGLCTIPFYKMFVDYDGSYLLCCDDWLRKSKTKGNNIFEMSINEYFYNQLHKKKCELISHGRVGEPCSMCTANGKMMGMNYVKDFAAAEGIALHDG